jgi:hypothetical protein
MLYGSSSQRATPFFNRYRCRFLNEKVKDEDCGETDGIVIHGEQYDSCLICVNRKMSIRSHSPGSASARTSGKTAGTIYCSNPGTLKSQQQLIISLFISAELESGLSITITNRDHALFLEFFLTQPEARRAAP